MASFNLANIFLYFSLYFKIAYTANQTSGSGIVHNGMDHIFQNPSRCLNIKVDDNEIMSQYSTRPSDSYPLSVFYSFKSTTAVLNSSDSKHILRFDGKDWRLIFSGTAKPMSMNVLYKKSCNDYGCVIKGNVYTYTAKENKVFNKVRSHPGGNVPEEIIFEAKGFPDMAYEVVYDERDAKNLVVTTYHISGMSRKFEKNLDGKWEESVPEGPALKSFNPPVYPSPETKPGTSGMSNLVSGLGNLKSGIPNLVSGLGNRSGASAEAKANEFFEEGMSKLEEIYTSQLGPKLKDAGKSMKEGIESGELTDKINNAGKSLIKDFDPREMVAQIKDSLNLSNAIKSLSNKFEDLGRGRAKEVAAKMADEIVENSEGLQETLESKAKDMFGEITDGDMDSVKKALKNRAGSIKNRIYIAAQGNDKTKGIVENAELIAKSIMEDIPEVRKAVEGKGHASQALKASLTYVLRDKARELAQTLEEGDPNGTMTAELISEAFTSKGSLSLAKVFLKSVLADIIETQAAVHLGAGTSEQLGKAKATAPTPKIHETLTEGMIGKVKEEVNEMADFADEFVLENAEKWLIKGLRLIGLSENNAEQIVIPLVHVLLEGDDDDWGDEPEPEKTKTEKIKNFFSRNKTESKPEVKPKKRTTRHRRYAQKQASKINFSGFLDLSKILGK